MSMRRQRRAIALASSRSHLSHSDGSANRRGAGAICWAARGAAILICAAIAASWGERADFVRRADAGRIWRMATGGR